MRRTAASLLLLAAALLAACATYQLEKRLDPVSKDFLSKVRYLITREERRTFVNLPEPERPKFIDEFWKKRDPDSETTENEFKIEYFQRIDEANHLFSEGQEPGWLQDRGRIYILLGPPSEREAFPRGVTFYGKPTEIWYYNFFPIVFIDDAWSGNYRLDPDSAVQLGMIMRAQMEWKPQVEVDKKVLHCEMSVDRSGPDQVRVRIGVPYKKIWMSSDGKDLRTTLTVALEVLDAAGAKIGDYQNDYPISLTEARMEEIVDEEFVIEFSLALKTGASMLNLTLTNAADGGKVFKRTRLAP
ncbi:MAG: GWxTD domain-containing protein [Candidatus Aminicenantes bacterium]|nr:GWxTD domain-containing protein [Candidatus Aminicenantes bacterium]